MGKRIDGSQKHDRQPKQAAAAQERRSMQYTAVDQPPGPHGATHRFPAFALSVPKASPPRLPGRSNRLARKPCEAGRSAARALVDRRPVMPNLHGPTGDFIGIPCSSVATVAGLQSAIPDWPRSSRSPVRDSWRCRRPAAPALPSAPAAGARPAGPARPGAPRGLARLRP